MIPNSKMQHLGFCDVLLIYVPAEEFDEEVFDRAWTWLRQYVVSMLSIPHLGKVSTNKYSLLAYDLKRDDQTAYSSARGAWDDKIVYPQQTKERERKSFRCFTALIFWNDSLYNAAGARKEWISQVIDKAKTYEWMGFMLDLLQIIAEKGIVEDKLINIT